MLREKDLNIVLKNIKPETIHNQQKFCTFALQIKGIIQC